MTPEDIPACVAGTCLTAVPFQAHLSSPTLCSIKLNFPSIFNGLLIDEDWAIAFRLHARGGEEESFTYCLQVYNMSKTPCLPPLLLRINYMEPMCVSCQATLHSHDGPIPWECCALPHDGVFSGMGDWHQ